MNLKLTMSELITCFNDAKSMGYKFVAIRVQMAGFPRDEVIVNEIENVDTKLEYYNKTYDFNLKHKFAQGISIVGFCYGDDMLEIQEDLLD